MPTPETRRQLLTAVAACDDKKGEDTRILELDPADSGLADFFLITSATNDRQVVAIADEIEFRLKKEYGLYATSVEGRRQGEWILLDYSDIVIHVFLAEKRAFYDIERLRKSARPLTGPEVDAELKAELAKKTIAVRKHTPAKPAVKAAKPAKKAIPSSSKKQSSIPARNMASSKKSLASVNAIQSAKGDSSVSPTKKAAKKAPAKAAKKAAKAPLKSAAKKAPAKAAKKAPIKAAAKKAPAKKAAPKKAAKPAVKAAKKAPAKKAAPKKVAIKKVAAKKAAPIKATVKKAAKKKVVAPPTPPPPPSAPLAAVEAPVEDISGPMHGIISQGAKPPVIK